MNSIMEIKQKSRKDKTVTLYDRIEARTAEQTLKKIVEINMDDESYINEGKEWAHQNMVEGATFKLTPISLYLSTPGEMFMTDWHCTTRLNFPLLPLRSSAPGKLCPWA